MWAFLGHSVHVEGIETTKLTARYYFLQRAAVVCNVLCHMWNNIILKQLWNNFSVLFHM